MNNYATHKTKPIRAGLAKLPRWHALHANRDVLDQLGRAFFALITDKRIRRGVHRSAKQLEIDIRARIDSRNANPKPFRWTKSADDILAAIQRFCSTTNAISKILEAGHQCALKHGIRTPRDAGTHQEFEGHRRASWRIFVGATPLTCFMVAVMWLLLEKPAAFATAARGMSVVRTSCSARRSRWAMTYWCGA